MMSPADEVQRVSYRPCPQPERQAESPSRRWSASGRQRTSGFVVSMVFHAALLVILALVIESAPLPGDFFGLTLDPTAPPTLETSIVEEPARDEAARHVWEEGRNVPLETTVDLPPIGSITPQIAPPADRPPSPGGVGPARVGDAARALRPGGWEGRTPAGRAGLLGPGGGTPASEAAVERGLRWLAAQQHAEGHWTFYHPEKPTRAPYQNPGTETSTTAATAMVLLPFLGAGYTHAGGQYEQVVGRGLYYLNRTAVFGPQGADLREGTMYAQGLAALALCEAYTMTRDPTLRDTAQKAIDFIVYAQDKKGGGWRYTPGEPGDTTVTGWQLMALTSAQKAGLSVPSPTLVLAERFLDSVAVEYGAQYGYMEPRPRRSTTAIGLLCRMYSGWPRERSELVRGVDHLAGWGPSPTDLYYDYYATQVLRHWEGPQWEKWNATMRDHLVRTQSAEGLESGSWHFPDPNGDKGGRLYSTAMAVMILEVYYRYLPLYQPVLLEDEPEAAAPDNS